MRMTCRANRRLRAISLIVAGLAVLTIIGSALIGCSKPGGATPGTSPTPTPTLATATTAPKTAVARVTRKHHRKHHRAVTPAVTAPPIAATPAGCHPLSNEGTCYEPGEYCRNSDHGATGVAGDGETITCEDNNGWRWEPS